MFTSDRSDFSANFCENRKACIHALLKKSAKRTPDFGRRVKGSEAFQKSKNDFPNILARNRRFAPMKINPRDATPKTMKAHRRIGITL